MLRRISENLDKEESESIERINDMEEFIERIASLKKEIVA